MFIRYHGIAKENLTRFVMLHELMVQHHIVVRCAAHQLHQQVVGRRARLLRLAFGKVSLLGVGHVEQEPEYLMKPKTGCISGNAVK